MKKEKKENNNPIKNNEQDKKALKKVKKAEKEKLSARFIKSIKKRWLISGTNTILLIAIIVAIFILINSMFSYFDFTAIDCTTSQDYTLTDESKERVADIDKEVNIYFVGWDETDQDYILAKQYNKANSNINVEIVDATENLEIANKYDVTNDDYAIIIECGETYRILSYYDIITYDSSYNVVDIAEQKITSAILNVTSDEIPKVYFLTGYTSFSFNYGYGLYYLSAYLDEEVLTYEELNILSTQEVPEDCDTLIIMTPEKDFDEITADAIIDYIYRGGNILWLNGAYLEETDLTNVNRVLAEFGIDPFEVGGVYETDTNNMIGYDICFIPEVQYTDVTEDIYTGLGLVFYLPTKININTDELEELNVEETDLVLSSDTTYFTTDLYSSASSDDEEGGFVLGAQMVKTVQEAEESDDSEDSESSDDTDDTEDSEETEEITSTLIIFGNDYFITDYQISNNYNPMIYIYNNADLVLNSIASLSDRDQDITIRKSYTDSVTDFTATDGQKTVIMKIIFIVPIAIILIGLIIWINRKRRQ